MNIVIFSKRWARARHFELGHPLAVGVGVVAAALLFGGAFLAGIRWGAQSQPVAYSVAAASTTASASNPANVQLGEQLEDLAARVGQVNAQMLRLNALGKRLTEMAHLDKGEFNFDAPPAQGGPEEVDEPAELADGLDGILAKLEDQLIDRERQLVILETFISARQLTQLTVPDGSPVPGAWISSTFGRRTDPFTGKMAYHSGIDFAAPAGAQARAVAPGVVTWAGNRSGYGQLVEINHGNGYVTRYAHNSSLLVKVGDKVSKGQGVSRVGSTGRSTGPHLHFEVLRNGQAIESSQVCRLVN
ncbi:MAG: M23 family metallopeptidase [Steroidobacteraceae bacterium]